MNVNNYKLIELTDFVCRDYKENLENTIGLFKQLNRDQAEEMAVKYIASSYPFAFAFNDFCRLISAQGVPGGNSAIHPEVVEHTRSDIEHFNLYERDFIKCKAWEQQVDIEPFLKLHNTLWRSYASTPVEYYHHLLMLFEVMSEVWLEKWNELCQHHQLEFDFLGHVHLDEDDYTEDLVSHDSFLEEQLPRHIFWNFKTYYDEISSVFIKWFSDELTRSSNL